MIEEENCKEKRKIPFQVHYSIGKDKSYFAHFNIDHIKRLSLKMLLSYF